MLIGGCSDGAAVSWARPALAPVDVAYEASFRSYSDFADAAHAAGTVVTGTFIKHDPPAAIADIFPAAKAQTADARALEAINKERVATLWAFRVDDVAKVAIDPGRADDK